MINKRQFRIANDKKLLHKVGKHWVVLSAMAIALLGGGAAVANVPVHASQVQETATESADPVKAKINKNLNQAYQVNSNQAVKPRSASNHSMTSSNAIQKQAVQMHATLLGRTPTNVNHSMRLGSIGFGYGDNQQGQSNADDDHWILNNGKYLSNSQFDNDWKNSTTPYKGLNYKYATSNNVTAVEFTDGTTNTDLSGFTSSTAPNDIQNATSIKFDQPIYVQPNTSMRSMFANDHNLQSLDFSKYFNTYYATSMNSMFKSDTNLQSIQMGSDFDTTNVSDMQDMFANDGKISSLVFPSNFNTNKAVSAVKNAQNLDGMLSGTALQQVTINSSNTRLFNLNSNPTLYKQDSKDSYTSLNSDQLQEGNVGTFVNPPTRNNNPLNKYSDVFHNTDSTTINSTPGLKEPSSDEKAPSDWVYVKKSTNPSGYVVSSTPQYRDGNIMVAPSYRGLAYKYSVDFTKHNPDGSPITSIEFIGGTLSPNVSDFIANAPLEIRNANNVTFDSDIQMPNGKFSMENMFKDAYNLKNLTLGNGFDTSNVTNMSSMFFRDGKLQSITFPNVNKGTSYPSILKSGVKNINGAFDTGNVTDMHNMFQGDSDLQSLSLPESFDTHKVTNMENMFIFGSHLNSLQLPNNFDTSDVSNMSHMFYHDRMTKLTLPVHFNTKKISKPSQISDMFTRSDNPNVKLPQLQQLNIKSNDLKITKYSIQDGLQADSAEVYLNNNDTKQQVKTFEYRVKDSHYQTYAYNSDSEKKYVSTRNADVSRVDNGNNNLNGKPNYRIINYYPKQHRIDITTNNTLVVHYINKGPINQGQSNLIKSDSVGPYKIGSNETYNVNIPNGYELLNIDPTKSDFSDISDSSDSMTGTKISTNVSQSSVNYTMTSYPQIININVKPVPKNDTNKITNNGNVTLNYYSNSNENKNNLVESIEVPYSVTGESNHVVTLLNGNYTSNNVTGIDKNGNNQRFDASNYVPDPNNDYQTIELTNDNQNGSYELNFYLRPVTDNIIFNGVSNENTVSTGGYDTRGSVNAPKGYHFNGSSTGEFTYGLHNGTHTFNVAHNVIKDTINYRVSNVNTLYSKADSVVSSDVISNSSTDTLSSTISSAGNQYVKTGYTMTSPTSTISHTNSSDKAIDSVSDTIWLTPNTDSITVNFENGTKSISASTYSGPVENSASITPPSYYNFSSGQISTLTYAPNASNSYDSSVNITPSQASANVYYQVSDTKASNNSSSTATFTSKGNYYLASSASDTSFNATSASSVPSGYHIISGQNTNIPFDNNSKGNHVIKIAPNTITDTINYKVANNANYAKSNSVISTSTANLNDDRASGAGSLSVNADNNIPSGYSLSANTSSTFSYETNSASSSTNNTVWIVPKSESENIHYSYSGHSLGSTNISGGFYDNIGSVSMAPSGWSLSSTSNTFTFGKNNGSDDVNVVPSEVTDTIYYYSNNSNVDSKSAVFRSNDYRSASNNSGYSDNQFNLTSANASNIPNGYHLYSANQTFNYDGKDHNASVDPNSADVQYTYSSGTINSEIASDSADFNTFSASNNLSSAVSSGNDKGLPYGWHLTNPSTSISFDSNNKTTVYISPNTINETIDYDVVNSNVYAKHGQSLASTSDSINDDRALAAGNNSLVISSGNATNLPSGYHLASSSYKFSSETNSVSSNATGIVYVAPNTENETVYYVYGYNNSSVSTSTISSGYYDNNGSVSTAPSGWSLSSANNSFTFDSNNGSVNVNVVPSNASATVNYQVSYSSANNNGSTIAYYTSSGNSAATSTGNFSFNDISDDSVPAGYHIISGQNTNIPFDNNNHIIQIAPNTITDTINYQVASSASYAKSTQVLNSAEKIILNNNQASGAGYYTSNIASSGNTYVSSGYHMLSSSATVGNHSSNATDTITIVPDSESVTVHFSYGSNSIASSTYSGYVDGSTVASAPNHYSLSAGQNSEINFSSYANGSSNASMQVVPTSVSDTIDYVSSANDTNSLGSAKISGLYSTSVNDGTNNATFSKVPTGYTVSGTPSLTYDAKTHKVVVTPITASADVQYQYNGKTIASDDTDYHGNDSRATDAGDNSIDITPTNDKGLPNGWHLASDKTNVPFDNGKHGVKLAPNTQTDPIHYQYNGKTISSHNFTGNDYRATEAGDNNFDVTKTNDPDIPAGYHLANKDNQFNYDGQDHNVVIEPNTDTDVVDYNYGNKTLGSHDFSGNDSHATNAGNNGFDINYTNEPGIPAGYHLVPNANDNNQSDYHFNYDNKTKVVPIVPNHVSDTIQYQYKGKTITTHKFGGNDYRAKSAGNNSVDITPTNDPDIPAGYHLANNDNKFDYNGSTNSVAILPNSVTDTVNYQSNGKTLSTQDFTGNYNSDVPQTTIDGSVPQHYHVVSGDTNNTYQPNGKINVTVAASDVTDYINFNGDSGTNTTKTGPYKTSGQVSAPNNYHFINGSNGQFTYGNDNGTHTFDVAPDNDTDTVNYVDNKSSQKVGSPVTISGNYNSSAKSVIDARQPDPNDWTIVSGDNVQFTPNKTFNVTVSRNTAKDTIEYQYKGQTRGTQSFSGNTHSDLDVTNGNAQLPNGYQLVKNDNQTTYNGSNVPVAVTPKRVTENVTYVDQNGKQIGTSHPYTGNDVNAQGASDTSFNANDHVPANYHAIGNTTFNYDDQAHTVTVAPNPETDDVNYIDSYGSHIKNTQIHGNYNSDAKGAIDAELPAHYHVISGDTGVFTPYGTFNVNVANNSSTPNKPASGSSATPANGSATKPVKPSSGSQASGSTAKPASGSTGSSVASSKSQSQSSSAVAPSSGSKPASSAAKPNSSSASGQSTSSTSSNGSSAARPASSTSSASSQVPSSATPNGGSTASKASSSAASKASSQSSSASQSSASVTPSSGSKTSGSTIQSSSSSVKSAGSSSQASGSTASSSSSVTSKTSSSASSKSASGQSSNASQSVTPNSGSASSTSAANSSSASSEASSSAASNKASGQSSSTSQSTSQSSASVAPSSSSNPKSGSTSVEPSSSAASVTPYVPVVPSFASSSVSSASSVASQSTQAEKRSAKPVSLTKMGYPITHSKNLSKPDVVTYMGRKYPVHYHANGKNTIRVRESVTKHGKRSYRYKNVVVSTSLPVSHPSSANVVREIDRIDFNNVAKRVWTAKGLNKVLNRAKPGKVVAYYGNKMAALPVGHHFRYFMINKQTLGHDLIIGNAKKYLNLRTHHQITLHINKIVVVHKKHANYIRYEFNVGRHNFWVTGRSDYTPNSYWQKSDLKANHTMTLRVIHGAKLYTSPYYTTRRYIKTYQPGTILHVKKIFFLGHHGKYNMLTRFQLTNGKFVTSNKNYVQLLADVSYSNHVPYRYLKARRDLTAHANPVFTSQNAVTSWSPRENVTVYIDKLVKVRYNGQTYYRYEINLGKHHAYVTADSRYVENAYWQPNEFINSKREVRVVRLASNYKTRSYIQTSYFRPGTVLHIKRTLLIGRIHSNEVTRFQLTDGRYLTSNKNYVQLIK